MTKAKQISLYLGPAIFLLMQLIGAPSGIPVPAYFVLAATIWMAMWWVFEPIPIPATSLLPMVVFPIGGVMSMKAAIAPYSSSIIYLFVGGFILALAMEKWNLHKRIALNVIAAVGTNLKLILLGFVLATGLLSMWISNTATTLMMLPIALSIFTQFQQIEDKAGQAKAFGKALVLCIAFSASIGGMATLVGSPTNLIFAEAVNKAYNVDVPFAQWFWVGLPISLTLMGVCWWHLTFNVFRIKDLDFQGGKSLIQQEIKALGIMSTEEKRVLIIFSLVAFAWMTRKLLINPLFPLVNDTHIALIGALSLFVFQAPNEKGSYLMDWQTAVKLPWGILLLFGGAFSLAAAFEASGLTVWIGEKLHLLNGVPFWLILLVIVASVNFLTEITQNMATCTLMMPILIALSSVIDVHPYGIMVATCIAASCAFMMPFATAPNAIVFGAGLLEVRDMIRAGFMLNILSILVITFFVYVLMPLIWGIDLNAFPIGFR